MNPNVFDRQQHLYKNPAFSELVKDAVRFFNGTPVHMYQKYAAQNRLAYNQPIYVGKAVPTGWRQVARSRQHSSNLVSHFGTLLLMDSATMIRDADDMLKQNRIGTSFIVGAFGPIVAPVEVKMKALY
jgi:hypothetical protein